MLWVSVFALMINGGITLALHSGRRDLNLRSVWIHNLGDALSNVAIVVGALAIRYTGATWADPVIGIAIGAMVLWSGIGILRESSHILLEGLPRSIALEEVARAMLRIEGVQEVHDIHIWTLGTDLNALSCHICIPDMHMEESEKVLAKIREVLDQRIPHHPHHDPIRTRRPPRRTPASTCPNQSAAPKAEGAATLRIGRWAGFRSAGVSPALCVWSCTGRSRNAGPGSR